MRTRCGLWLLIAVSLLGSGCASTARRSSTSPVVGSKAWGDAPAPPQRALTAAPDRSPSVFETSARPEGLARYFPGLHREVVEAPQVAARPRPSLFGLRTPRAIPTQTYMTDIRGRAEMGGPEPSILPVALQVPSDRAPSDREVTPTNAEAPSGKDEAAGPSPKVASTDGPVSTALDRDPLTALNPSPDLGPKPSKPAPDTAAPLTPSSEASQPRELTNKMPAIPSVDPLEPPKVARASEKPATTDAEVQDENAVRTGGSRREPSQTPQWDESDRPVYSRATGQAHEPTTSSSPQTMVMASPQMPPPRPTPQTKPSPQAKPSPQTKPSPQGAVTETTAKKEWQRPCLRRLVRRVCNLGEYANPPTAKPH